MIAKNPPPQPAAPKTVNRWCLIERSRKRSTSSKVEKLKRQNWQITLAVCMQPALLETNSQFAPENGWLEYDPVPFGVFLGVNWLLVSGSVFKKKTQLR